MSLMSLFFAAGNTRAPKGGIFSLGGNQKQSFSFGLSGNTGSTSASQVSFLELRSDACFRVMFLVITL